MPFYVYKCDECDATDVVSHGMQALSDSAHTILCRRCWDPMRRLPSLPSPPQGGDTPKHHRRS